MSITKHIFIDQGSSFYLEMTATDQYGSVINITGSTGYSQIRKSPYSSSYTNMSVGLTGQTGGFYLSLSATASAAMDPGRYLYDVEFVWGNGTTKRVKQGSATIDPEITR